MKVYIFLYLLVYLIMGIDVTIQYCIWKSECFTVIFQSSISPQIMYLEVGGLHLSIHANNISEEITVSQIADLGLRFHFMPKYR